MSVQTSDIETGLKELLNNRIINDAPPTCSHGWVYFAKHKLKSDGLDVYKMGHTGRIDTHLENVKNDDNFSDEEPIVIKVVDGASYFSKVLRRIFKTNKISPEVGGRNLFSLNHSEIEWLNSIRLCKSFGLDSEVADLLGANTTAALRKEGLS